MRRFLRLLVLPILIGLWMVGWAMVCVGSASTSSVTDEGKMGSAKKKEPEKR